jgi:DNA gyrase subunit B
MTADQNLPESDEPLTPVQRIDAHQAGASEGYGEGAITILEGLEAVRKRPGDVHRRHLTSPGLHHLVQEVVDNSIDEAMAGHCDQIDLTMHIGQLASP